MLPGGNYGLEDNSPCLSRAASELPCTGLDGGLPYSTPYIFLIFNTISKYIFRQRVCKKSPNVIFKGVFSAISFGVCVFGIKVMRSNYH